MNKTEARARLDRLARMYPRSNTLDDDGFVAEYVDYLAELDAGLADTAIRAALRRYKYLPRLAELVELVEELRPAAPLAPVRHLEVVDDPPAPPDVAGYWMQRIRDDFLSKPPAPKPPPRPVPHRPPVPAVDEQPTTLRDVFGGLLGSLDPPPAADRSGLEETS